MTLSAFMIYNVSLSALLLRHVYAQMFSTYRISFIVWIVLYL